MQNEKPDKRNRIKWCCAFIALCVLYAMSVFAFVGKYGMQTPWLGQGTLWNPYQIQTPEDFILLCERMKAGEDFYGAHFKQTKDLDFSEVRMNQKCVERISKKEVSARKFAGVYDGAGNRLKGIDQVIFHGIAFEELSGKIVNLGLEDSPEFTLVGRLTEKGSLVNCWNIIYTDKNKSGSYEAKPRAYAGLVNEYGGGQMLNCWSARAGQDSASLKWMCKFRTSELNLLFWRIRQAFAL